MIAEIQMYLIICDHEGCEASPQDDSDHWAYTWVSSAMRDTEDTDWFVGNGLHLCPEDAPVCADPDCAVRLRNSEFGDRCEDHALDEATP